MPNNELTLIPSLVRHSHMAAKLAASDLRISARALDNVSYTNGILSDESSGEVRAIRAMLFLKYYATDPEGGMQNSYSPIARIGGLRVISEG